MRAIALGILIIGTATTAAASDVEIHDFRVEVGVTPGPHSTKEDFTPGSGSGGRPAGSTTWKSNASPCLDVWAGWAYSEIHDQGFCAALGLDLAEGVHSPRGLGSRSLQYQTLSPQVRVGWAYAFNTSFHVELTPFLGFGAARTEWADNGAKDSGWGTALTYGLLAAGWARLGEGWSLGGNAGWQGGQTTVSVDNGHTGGQSDLTMTTSGVVARIGVGYQF